jgi:hypothetical protein
MPYKEQIKIYNDWLDQAHVRVVTADRTKAPTARAELEARVPAPTKPKAEWYNTDIVDKMQIGYQNMVSGAAKTAAAFMPEGNIKQGLYDDAALAEAKQKALRTELNPETLDAEKQVALDKQNLTQKYGGEDNIPFTEATKQGVSNVFQGGAVQAVGNIGQSLASSLPSVVGNVARVAGAGLTATGAGAVLGVPLMVAGTGLATVGGAIATAGDVGGDVNEEATKLAAAKGLTGQAAKDFIEAQSWA